MSSPTAQGSPDPGEAEVPAGMLAAVVAIVAARAGLAQVVEVSGRRTATRVLSAMRAELVGRRLRRGAAAAGGGSAELAAGAVQGVDGLETYFARYLSQVVLAVVVPVAVLCWSAAVDLTSALVRALTLPVVPVFMALIERSGRLSAIPGSVSMREFHAWLDTGAWYVRGPRGDGAGDQPYAARRRERVHHPDRDVSSRPCTSTLG